ncbi:MAG TPA: hypothetical protein DCZ95_17255 [Verrucomicrobia bacterium]|nr:MAG: hypothetical protein A2X46_09735 [Lentisphaerae bacterium GWF2_57_35]HBA85833.1 hypothetical protein [Verrucomicrobiota bacterium]
MALVFLGLLVWWCLYVPYKPDLVFKALPGDASVVSIHRNLAERWDEFSGNPLTLSLFGALGIQSEDLASLGQDPESRAWLNALAGEKIALAFVPNMGLGHRPAWVAASWLGGRSQRFRWQLHWARTPVFRRLDNYRGHPMWLVRAPFLEPGSILTISLVEGMLLACLSQNPGDIRRVLDTYDGYQASVMSQTAFVEAIHPEREPASDDMGWVHFDAIHPRIGGSGGDLLYSIPLVTKERLKGRLSSRTPIPHLRSLTAPIQTGDLDRLWGGLPVVVAVVGRDTALNGLLFPQAPSWVRQLGRIVAAQNADAVFLGAFGDDYSGRIMGLKIPSLIAAVRCPNEESALKSISQALDRLNAQKRWGLIPRPFTAAGRQVFAIEATGESPMSRMTVEESPAYAVCGGWLLFSSNLDALLKLVERYERVESTQQASLAPWRNVADGSLAPVHGWIDLDRGSKTLRLAVSTWSLKMLLDNPTGSQQTRQQLNEAKAWIDAIAPLKELSFHIDSGVQESSLEIEIGSVTP